MNKNLFFLLLLALINFLSPSSALAGAYRDPGPGVPYDFYKSPDSIVKVSSLLFDYTQQKVDRVYGAGSIIVTQTSPHRYFVLTVNHISVGDDLIVESPSGEQWPIKNKYYHDEADLALLEIDVKDPKNPPPAIGCFCGDQINTLFDLASFDRSAAPRGALGWITSLSPYFEFPAIEVEFSDTFSTGHAHSLAIQPPWLPAPRDSLQDTHWKKWLKEIPRSPDVKDIETYQLFPPGYSGAPILIPIGLHDRFEVPKYFISGIITTSTSDKVGVSSFLGPARINDFFKQVLRNKIKPLQTVKNYWFLMNGTFVHLGSTVEVYLLTGPIGNGIVVEGFIGKEKADLAKVPFEKQMLQRGITPEHLNELNIKITDLKKEVKDSSGNSAQRQELIEKIKSMNTEFMKIK